MQSGSTRGRRSADAAAACTDIPAAVDATSAALATGGCRSTADRPGQLYVIRCSRKSQLVEYDDDSFIDRYGEEADKAEEEIDDSATYRDGSWVFDLGWGPGSARTYHPADVATPGLSRSPGTVRVFGSLAAANAAAALVWQSLQVNHGFNAVAPEATAGPKARKAAGPTGGLLGSEEPLHNLVSSTLAVEVVKAQAEW